MSRKIKGKYRGLTEKEVSTRLAAYDKKVDEYSNMTIEELIALAKNPDKRIRPGGIYRIALHAVIEYKTTKKDAQPNVGESLPEAQTLPQAGEIMEIKDDSSI